MKLKEEKYNEKSLNILIEEYNKLINNIRKLLASASDLLEKEDFSLFDFFTLGQIEIIGKFIIDNEKIENMSEEEKKQYEKEELEKNKSELDEKRIKNKKATLFRSNAKKTFKQENFLNKEEHNKQKNKFLEEFNGILNTKLDDFKEFGKTLEFYLDKILKIKEAYDTIKEQ